MNTLTTENRTYTREIFEFFFSDIGLPSSSSPTGDELAALIAYKAMQASGKLNYVPMPPVTPPRVVWLLKSVVEGAWKSLQSDKEIHEMVYNVIRRNYRSAYEALLAEMYEQVEELIKQPVRLEHFTGFPEGGVRPETTQPSMLFQGTSIVAGSKFISYVGKSTAVNGTSVPRNATAGVIFALCSEKYEEGRALGIDISLGGKIDTKGSAELKVKLLQEMGLKEESIVMVVYARKSITHFAHEVRFKGEVKYPSPEFHLHYGDNWISRMTIGAEVCVLYNYICRSREEKNEFLGSFNLSGLMPGASINFDASVQLKMKKFVSSTRCLARHIVTGIQKPIIVDPKTADMYAYINNFLATEPDAPSILDYETSDYAMIPR